MSRAPCSSASHAALKSSRAAFETATLPLVDREGLVDDGDGGAILLRHCRYCNSTLAIELAGGDS